MCPAPSLRGAPIGPRFWWTRGRQLAAGRQRQDDAPGRYVRDVYREENHDDRDQQAAHGYAQPRGRKCNPEPPNPVRRLSPRANIPGAALDREYRLTSLRIAAVASIPTTTLPRKMSPAFAYCSLRPPALRPELHFRSSCTAGINQHVHVVPTFGTEGIVPPIVTLNRKLGRFFGPRASPGCQGTNRALLNRRYEQI